MMFTNEKDPINMEILKDAVKTCTINWKNIKAKGLKQAWSIFKENGIFTLACRYGLMLWFVNMYKSDELQIFIYN